MMTQNYMVRVTTPFFYSLEFIVAISVFFVALYLFIKDIDKKSLFVFILAGVVNCCIELFLQGVGFRIIEDAFFFNMPFGYPWICLVIGFYEGGVKVLLAYHFIRWLVNSDKVSKKMFVFLASFVFVSFLTYSALSIFEIGAATLTVRDMFALMPILLLALAFGASTVYFFFNKEIWGIPEGV